MPAGFSSKSSLCPDNSELKSFAMGDLSSERLQQIGCHVHECERCQDVLQAFDALDDDLTKELRSVAGVAASNHGYVPDEVFASANAAVLAATQLRTPEFAFDSGRHFARLLQDGACRLGRFELLAELGSGSFGYVFRARDVELDRIVAIKVQRSGALPRNSG